MPASRLDCGDVVGMTSSTPIALRGRRRAPDDGGNACSCPAGRQRVGRTQLCAAGSGVRATTRRGPLEPGAESVGDEVVGLPGGGPGRVVALVGRAQPDGEGGDGQERPSPRARPRRAAAGGVARTSAHRGPSPGAPRRSVGPSASRRRSRRPRIRRPRTPNSAGRSVVATATARATVIAAARPTPVRKLTLEQDQPEHRDGNGRPGEDDGPPGGVRSADCCLARRCEPRAQAAAGAG